MFMFNISETILNPTEVTGTCVKRRKNPNTSAGLEAVFQMSLSCMFLTKTGQLTGYVVNKAVVEIMLYVNQIGICGMKTEIAEKWRTEGHSG